MLDFHGIIFAYRTTPALGELVRSRIYRNRAEELLRQGRENA